MEARGEPEEIVDGDRDRSVTRDLSTQVKSSRSIFYRNITVSGICLFRIVDLKGSDDEYESVQARQCQEEMA